LDTQIVNELFSVLDQESKIYGDILKIAKNKTSIVVEGRVAELENIVKLEQSLVLQLAKFESQRELLIDKLSRASGLKPDAVTISEIISRIGSAQGEKLKSLQQAMSLTIQDLKSTNELNSRLIKNSLDFINFSLGLFVNADSTDNNYGVSGEKPSGKTKNFFDAKI
jgi:flagellar biosynthesis/type III secretory pathway chaperone